MNFGISHFGNSDFKGLDVTTDGPKWSRLGLGKMLFHPATDLNS